MRQDFSGTVFATLPSMNIYRISQSNNTDYDTYDSAVVVARDEQQARHIHPDECSAAWHGAGGRWSTWADPSKVTVEYLATLPADSRLQAGAVICASFNAG